MYACTVAWNMHVQDERPGEKKRLMGGDMYPLGPKLERINNNLGLKYSFSTPLLSEDGTCGWYFIPGGGESQAAQAASLAQTDVINATTSRFDEAASEIVKLIPPSDRRGAPEADTKSPATVLMNPFVVQAIYEYVERITSAINTIDPNHGRLDADATLITRLPSFSIPKTQTFWQFFNNANSDAAFEAREQVMNELAAVDASIYNDVSESKNASR
jgi:hypothetical protein